MMQCDRCHKNEAVLHVTQVHNGHKEERHLCEKCAQETGELPQWTQSPFDLWDTDFFKSLVNPQQRRQEQAQCCPQCGLTWAEFNERGRLGCARCYEVFADSLLPLLQRLQGATNHVGKVPSRGSGVFTTNHQIKRLQQQLNTALEKEEYEEAARLRDEIYALQHEPPRKKTEEGQK